MTTFLLVLQAIAALPQLIATFKQVVGELEERFGPDWPTRVRELHAASIQWQKAQTDKERTEAAIALSKAFNSHK